MSLFRSEMLPFHPPRYASRIGEGLARYGRPRASSARVRDPQAHDAHAHDAQAQDVRVHDVRAHDAFAPACRAPEEVPRASPTASADAAVPLAA